MTKKDFLLKLDEMLILDEGTLKGNEDLAALGVWDSLAVVNFIGLLDEEFDMVAPAESIAQCKTIGDLLNLAGDRLEN